MSLKLLSRGKSFMKLSNSINRMDTKARGVTPLNENRIDQKNLINQIVPKLKPMIVSALRKSYAKSKVGTFTPPGKYKGGPTGRLRRALENPRITFMNGMLRIGFPANTPNDVLVYANSINSGSVRQPKTAKNSIDRLGGRAKRTLKKAALQGRALNRRERRRFEKKLKQVHDGRIMERNPFKLGTAKVIPPKRFYFISAADARRIGREFRRLLNQALARTLRPRPGAGGGRKRAA